ncbi:hypothetical protein HYE67_005331 [Fusarium culmorum]|uniref:Uncharacterized protein n=1 Tax=Fusarium culmorum TaxID=5516 RepID=A0A2T4GS00_FUSCU|nr:hypothetical protein FCULG_00011770 [Fusarium culmorum]QPC63100.1 hypothetical protein HYE67_005331 [Fusarium culmorum]
MPSDNAQPKERLGAVESDSVDDGVLELDENLEGLTRRVEAIEESNHDSDKAISKDEIIEESATRLWAH